MRAISAGLATAQAVRSPRWEVTLAAAAMGQMPGAPMVEWINLVPSPGQVVFRAASACGRLGTGEMLRFRATATQIVMDYIADPTSAANWVTPTSTSVLRSHSALALCALRAPGTQIIRLFFVHTTNYVYYMQSTNNGSTWGSPVSVYTAAADAVGDLVAAYIDDGSVLDGPWFVGFSTYNGGTGQYSAQFVRNLSTTKDVVSYGPLWRCAGIVNDAPAATRHVCAVFRQADQGPSRIRLLDNLSGSFSNARDIDQTQAGLGGLHLYHARYCQVPEYGITLGMVGEGAYGAGSYSGVAGVFHTDGQAVADEGIILDGLNAPKDAGHVAMAASGAGDLYAVGEVAVWRGALITAPPTLPRPISYLYKDGEMELKLPVDSGGATLRPGMRLDVTRTARWNADSGSETLRLVVVRVEVGTDGIRVVANDALSYLGSARCRRPYLANDGTAAGAATVMRRLAARFGIPTVADNAALETASVMPVTVMPSESLRGGAYRVGSQSEWYLVPRADAWGLEMITPGTSDSGEHDGTAQALGTGEGVLWKAAVVREWRRLAFAYVLGQYSTDPDDGGAVAMASGRVEPGTRPLSYSFTNLRYNTAARVVDAATAEALRQADQSPGAEVTINGHLGLELFDVVEVTEGIIGWSAVQWRVRSIREEYDKGRLVMTLGLGDV